MGGGRQSIKLEQWGLGTGMVQWGPPSVPGDLGSLSQQALVLPAAPLLWAETISSVVTPSSDTFNASHCLFNKV